MQAKAYETQQTGVTLKGLDYDVNGIRLYVQSDDGTVTQVAEDTTGYSEGADVTLNFEAPAASGSPYDLAAKADLSSGDSRTLFQESNVLRVSVDIGS